MNWTAGLDGSWMGITLVLQQMGGSYGTVT
jgi:hypothetical protein